MSALGVYAQNQSVTQSPASITPTVIDVIEPCAWGAYLKKASREQHIPRRSLRDNTTRILDDLYKQLTMNFNWYIAVTGNRLGAGKSNTSIRLSWEFDPLFGLENCLAYSIQDLAEIIDARNKNMVIAYDEPQDTMNAADWQSIPEPTRRLITSQRENRINIVFATPNIPSLWYQIRRNLNYCLHIMYRCSSHVHGYIYERSGNPMATDEFIITGTFTFEDPELMLTREVPGSFQWGRVKYLIDETKRYHEKFKTEYTQQSKADFVVDQVGGGLALNRAKEFAAWWTHESEGTRENAKRGFVKVWAFKSGQFLTNSQMMEIWDYYTFMRDTGLLDQPKADKRRNAWPHKGGKNRRGS